MHKIFRADQVSNIAKNATIRPKTMSRAQNQSDLKFYCIFKDFVKRAFWPYTHYYTNSGPRDRCAHKPVKTTRFDPQTPLYGAYTLPTGSECADLWRSLPFTTRAFRAHAGSLFKFPPKTRCGLGLWRLAPRAPAAARALSSRAAPRFLRPPYRASASRPSCRIILGVMMCGGRNWGGDTRLTGSSLAITAASMSGPRVV